MQELWTPLPDWLASAKSQPLLARGADKLRGALPEDMQAMLDKKTQDDDAKVKTEVPPEKPEDADDVGDSGEKKPAEPPEEGYKPKERNDLGNLIEKSDAPADQPKTK